MGERKGVNKYYPPDYDPNKGGLNKFQGTHALRERARKLHLGILIIRFEMPYNIWCEGCENHIGTGVRYNAEKKKVGMYYSTPIYQFRMKCHLCDNHFEIKTDPANLDYVIVSGARRQERRWDPTENEQVVPEDKDVTRKMAVDAMFKLEHGVDDKKKSKEVDPTIKKLEEFQSERWLDDYGANSALRAAMRVKRDEVKAQSAKDATYNFIDPLLPADENDAKLAKLLQFTQTKTSDQLQEEKRSVIDAQSVFARLKTKKISPSLKKAYARQSLTGIINQSQKSFSNYRNSFTSQNLGIVLKKVSPGTSEEEHNKEEDQSQAGPSSCEVDSVPSEASGSLNSISETSTSSQSVVPSATSNQRIGSESLVNISSQNRVGGLVGYDSSTSDSE